MNTDFKNGKELLEFCEKEKISISRAMLLRESDQTEKTESSIYTRMETAWNIMKEAALSPISSPGKSIGGLISFLKLKKTSAVQQSAGELPMPWLYWRSMPPWV